MVNNDTNFKSIELLRCWCMKSLPTVFSDALSYNQQVCLLTKAINDMANTINGLPDYIIELVKELLNQLNMEEIVKEVLADLYFINVKNPPNNMTAAVGDGVTDDTAAIQAIISYLGGKRAYLFFPAGIYSVTGLNVTTNMSLVGLDRYQTTLQLRAGSNKDLLIGDLGSCTINDITLDANMPGQTQNCSVFDGNVGNMLVSNVIFKNGYNALSIDVDGLVQMDNILFDGVQGNGLSIGGDRVVANNIEFVHNSLNADTLITVSGTNCMLTNLLNTSSCNKVLNITGNNNVIMGVAKGTQTPYSATGTDNFIDIITSNGHEVIDGNYIHNTNGSVSINCNASTQNINTTNTVHVDGDDLLTANNSTETINTTKEITASDIYLNPTNPLKYGTVKDYNNYFKVIDMKDKNENPYNLLVPGADIAQIGNINSLTISAKRLGRWLIPFGNNTADKGATLAFSYSQGSYFIESANRMLVGFIPYNTADIRKNNDCMIREYNMSDGSLIREKVIPSGGHINGMGMDETNQIVYVAQTLTYDSSGETLGSKVILALDYATLSVKQVITVDTTLTTFLNSVSYDNYNNKLYAMSPNYIFEINSTTGAIISTIPLSKPNGLDAADLGYQDGAVKGGFIYQPISDPEGLIVYDMSGALVKVFNFPNYTDNLYAWSETEGITVLNNGDLMINCCTQIDNASEYCCTQVFHCSDTIAQLEKNLYRGNPNKFSVTYLDFASSVFNPTGLESAPFKIPGELLMSLKANTYAPQISEIRVTAGEYPAIRLDGMSNLHFVCNGASFSSIICTKCSNIYFANAVIKKTNFYVTNALYISRVTGLTLDNLLCTTAEWTYPDAYVFYIEKSSFTWLGGVGSSDYINPNTYDTGKLFYLIDYSLTNNSSFQNVFTSYQKLINTGYTLATGSVAPGSTLNFNSAITNGWVTNPTSNFRYINFEIRTHASSHSQCHKFRISSGNGYVVRMLNLADTIPATGFIGALYEMFFTVTSTGIEFTKSNRIILTMTAGGAVSAAVATDTDSRLTCNWFPIQ
jgi:hypothetical protein